MEMSRVGLIVPTLNAGDAWGTWLRAFEAQRAKPARRLVIDSSSSDATVPLAVEAGFEARLIARSEFDHGGTRSMGVELLRDVEVLVFLTQDAMLADPDSLQRLVDCFDDPRVGVAYGRQLPHRNAQPIGAHARLFNYPVSSQTRTLEDRRRYGIKTIFVSNSFAGYRRETLLSIGGFPQRTIMSEDTWVAAKLLLSGWKLAYQADATVHHSHDYRMREEFRRYFDIGVFHAHEPWLRSVFGHAEGEGRRFVVSELGYLSRRAPWLLPSAVMRTGLKYLGFSMGRRYRYLPARWQPFFSMNRKYWNVHSWSP